MRHGSIRSLVIGSAIKLRRFTVPTLCIDANLDRKQVYPILQDLADSGFVTQEALGGDAHRKPERPLNIYSLTEDPALKKRLMNEFAPFSLAELQPSPAEPESLARARASLDTLNAEMATLAKSASLGDLKRATLRLHELEQQLEVVAHDLEIAILRMNALDAAELPPVLETELRRLEGVRAELGNLRDRAEHLADAKRKAEEQASKTLRQAIFYGMAALGKAAVNALSPKQFENYYPSGQNPVWMAREFESARGFEPVLAAKNRSVKHSSQPQILHNKLLDLFERKYHEAATSEGRHVLVAVKTDVASAFRESSNENARGQSRAVLRTLCESTMRYATDPDTVFWAAKSVEAQFPECSSFASYNSLNFCFLAGNRSQAWSRWQGLQKREKLFFRSGVERRYPGLLVATVDTAQLTVKALTALERVLGSSFACSIVSTERIEAIPHDPYVMELSAYSLFCTSERLPVSDSLKMLAPKFYAYGPIEQALRRPGVPIISLATGLAGLGLPATHAQETAEGLTVGKALLVVSMSDEVGNPTLERLNQFVDHLVPRTAGRAEPITFAPTNPAAANESAKRGCPVVYAINRSGTLHRTFSVRSKNISYTTSDK